MLTEVCNTDVESRQEDRQTFTGDVSGVNRGQTTPSLCFICVGHRTMTAAPWTVTATSKHLYVVCGSCYKIV